MNMPAVDHDVAYGVLEQRSSDIYSFLAGTRPRIPEQHEVGLGGLSDFRSPGEEPAQCNRERAVAASDPNRVTISIGGCAQYG